MLTCPLAPIKAMKLLAFVAVYLALLMGCNAEVVRFVFLSTLVLILVLPTLQRQYSQGHATLEFSSQLGALCRHVDWKVFDLSNWWRTRFVPRANVHARVKRFACVESVMALQMFHWPISWMLNIMVKLDWERRCKSFPWFLIPARRICGSRRKTVGQSPVSVIAPLTTPRATLIVKMAPPSTFITAVAVSLVSLDA